MFLLSSKLESPDARLCGQVDLCTAQRLLRSHDKFLLLIFCTGHQGIAHGVVDRVYCLGEQPITRRKALPKALSDS